MRMGTGTVVGEPISYSPRVEDPPATHIVPKTLEGWSDEARRAWFDEARKQCQAVGFHDLETFDLPGAPGLVCVRCRGWWPALQ